MSIPVKCTSCGFSGHAPDAALGKHVKCRKCGTSILVQRLEPVPVAVAPAPTPIHVAPAAPTSSDTMDDKPPTTPPPSAETKAAPAADQTSVELLVAVPKQPWYYTALEIAATGYAIAAPILAVLLAVYLIMVYQEQPAVMFGGIALALLFALLSVALAAWFLTFLDIGRDVVRIRKQIEPDETGES